MRPRLPRLQKQIGEQREDGTRLDKCSLCHTGRHTLQLCSLSQEVRRSPRLAAKFASLNSLQSERKYHGVSEQDRFFFFFFFYYPFFFFFFFLTILI